MLKLTIIAFMLTACGSEHDKAPTSPLVGMVDGVASEGAKGDKGDRGDKGDKGDKGDTGAQGPQGLKGDKGDAALPVNQWLDSESGMVWNFGAHGAFVNYNCDGDYRKPTCDELASAALHGIYVAAFKDGVSVGWCDSSNYVDEHGIKRATAVNDYAYVCVHK